MNSDDIESRLQRQSLRRVPADWREEILSAARESLPHPGSQRPNRSWLADLNHRLSAYLWPSPKAWGALVAAWVVLIALNFSMREKPAVAARRTDAPSPAVIALLEQQKRLLAELMGGPLSPEAATQLPLRPRPQSLRREEWQGA